MSSQSISDNLCIQKLSSIKSQLFCLSKVDSIQFFARHSLNFVFQCLTFPPKFMKVCYIFSFRWCWFPCCDALGWLRHKWLYHISLEILCFPVHPPCRGPCTGTPAPVHWTGSLTVQLLLGEARARRYRRLAITPAPATHPDLGKRWPAPEWRGASGPTSLALEVNNNLLPVIGTIVLEQKTLDW